MNVFKREPSVVVGALVSILVVVAEAVQGAPSWKAAVPLIASAIIRQLVTPAK